jgi:Putative peptidoglycan binding domain
MANIRNLRQDEIDEARKVFKSSIDYQKVFIQEYGDGAMTYAYTDNSFNWYYIIFWSNNVYNNGAIGAGEARTFIHEMTHVWQGQHSTYPREYMIKSGASQSNGVWKDAKNKGFKDVLKDVWNNGPLTTWHDYRGRAYAFNMNEMGVNNFNDFNVEQQASIVESWYAPNAKLNHLKVSIPGGNMSTTDIRYPFITCNILAGKPNAQYIPVKSAPSQLGKGADVTIKAIQDKLVSLGLLDPKFANGYTGRHTTDAIRAYQKNNGLKVDGNFGGPNSETRKRLGIR